METYSQQIEFINNYLNKSLSKEAQKEFESKLKNDSEFNTLYQEHIVFVNGMDRVQIKADIQSAKRSYLTEKWIKISGLSIIIIGVFVMLFTLLFNTSENDPTSNNINLNTIIVDSTSTETRKAITETDTSEISVEHVTTTINEKYGRSTITDISNQKQAQNIRINVKSDTIIRCQEGTILKIKKESFINPKTGKFATGHIDLNVTEYYKLSDILMANLSTVSNGKQLETGGMLYVEAKQGNTKLELNTNASIEISFPTKNKKSDMQLFSGEWKDEAINWQLQSTDELEVIGVESPNEDHIIEVPFSVVEQVPTFPGCENQDNEARKKCTSDVISKFISRNFNTDIGVDLGLSGKQRIYSVFKIDMEGRVVFVQSRSSHQLLSEEADRVVNLLPQMLPGMQRGKPVIVPYSLPITFEIQGSQTTSRLRKTEPDNDSLSTSTAVVLFEPETSPVEMDTLYSEVRGKVELIREVMHDKDFPVDSLFIQEWDKFEKQKLIRIYGIFGANSQKTAMLRKPLFETEGSKFRILEDDSITRGGHVIRILWEPSQVPTTSREIILVPKRKFTAGTESLTSEEFELRLNDLDDTSISSRDVGYYVLKTSSLGWINCDRFINGRTKRIKYKLKIKNAEGASVSMIFKSYNSVLPSWYTNHVYDFLEVAANEDVTLVAIKRKDGKLYYDAIETKTESNPSVDFKFREISIEELKQELDKINKGFN